MKKVLTMLLFLVCFLFISPQQTEAANLSLNDLFKTPDKVETPTNFVPSLEKFLKNGKQTKGITTYSSIATNILTDVTMTDSKSNAFTDQNRPTLTEEVKINFTWSIPDELNVQAGDTYSFMLPNVFAIYEPINGTLGEYGDFSVGLDGTVVMTFNQNTQDSSDVHGTLDFTTNFNEQKIIGSTTVLITFPIQVAETVVLNFVPSGGSSLTKTGTTDTSYNPKQINWTINANGNQNYLTGLTLSDNVPAGLSIIPNSVSVYYLDVFTNGTNTLGNVVDPSQYTVNISGAGDLTVTFKSPTFQAYQIDYSTTIEDLSQTSFTNSISMSAQSTATVNATSKVSINRAKHINKSSTYTQKNQTIEWAIQYNYDEETIPVDKTDFTDTFSNTHVLQPGSIEVRNVSIDGSGNATIGALVSSDQYVISDASTSSVNGFKLSFNSSVNSAYQIVYETVPVADLLANLVINNKVVSSFGVEEVANASRSIQQGNIMKSVTETDYSQKKISWQQIINNNNYVMDSPFLRDQFTAGGLSLINNSVTIKDTLLGNKLLLQGTDYVFTPDPAGNGFTIQFIGSYQSGMTSTLQLNYDTTFNYAQLISGTNFLNTATLTWSTNGVPKTSSMNASVNPGSYTENNGFKSGSYDAVKRQLNWTVGANYNLYPINQLKISDTWDATHKLIPTSVQVHKMKLSSGQNGYTDGGLVDPNSYSLAITDQSVLVTFNAPTQGAYYIVYSTVSSNSKMLPKYSNTATLSDGGQLQETYNASVTVPNGGVYVDKSAVQSGGYVDWKVAINEGQSTINAAKITDNPSQNQVIVASTVQLYDTTVQSNGSYTQASPLVVNKDYSLNVATDNLTGKQTMTITFANTIIKPYILTYQTFIDANDQDTLSNSVTLSGSNITTENVSTTSNIVVEVSGGTGTGEGEQGLLTIQKSDSVNTSLPLEGVEFQLYDSTGVNLFRTGTTDASGKLQLGGLRFGNYLLKKLKRLMAI
ncbi:collagen binding domain-containing protein [Enterococcus rivorum]|uniref:collagen binding domain-containing protein n=1 Tax=Enterococcus rivorum TaxID=762845 RepID=UPI003629FAC0